MATAPNAARQYPDANGDFRNCLDPQSSTAMPTGALIVAPRLCLKSDVAPWSLSDQGKKQKCRFALRKEIEVFFTCGLHDPRSEVKLDVKSNVIGFFAEETNCLGYALGRPKPGGGDVDFKLASPADRYIPELMFAFLSKYAKKCKIKLASTGSFILPFGATVEVGYVAIDMWKGMAGGWHATRRARVGGKSLIISKDGRLGAVENFSVDESLSTNANIGYRSTPMYTMLVPEKLIGNWSLLGDVFG